MTKDFWFDEATHTYYLGEKRLYGVTTVLGVLAKPALIPWAAKETVRYIKDHRLRYLRGDVFSPTHFKEVLEEAPTAWSQTRDKSADIGTMVHDAVEQFLKYGSEPELDEAGMKMFNHFKTWVKDKNVLASEERVYSREHWYGGTFDFLVEIGGKLYVGDLKTSNGIYGIDYFVQMAGYEIARRELGHQPADGFVIVRCGKKGDFQEVYSTKVQLFMDCFLAALQIHKTEKEYKK